MDAPLALWIASFAIVLVIIYLVIWIKIARFYYTESIDPSPIPEGKITLIVPFRNEEHNLKNAVEHLNQHPDLHSVPLIFVNDHSTDNSILILQECLANSTLNARIIHLSNSEFSKKQAIHEGVLAANTPLIYTTDADCLIQPHTLTTLYSKLISTKAKLILGPVNFKYNRTFFGSSYQLLENISLVALGFYQLKHGKPTMGNGANMLFHKQTYLDLNPFESNKHIAGGDDIFFIEQCYLQNPQWVQYANTSQAEVFTEVCKTYSELYKQRIRWAKKSPMQQTKKTQFSQIILVLFFLFFGGCLTALLFVQAYALCLFIFTFKLLGDVYFLREMARKSGHHIPFLEICKASFFQPIFILWVAISQFWAPVHWKNRMYP